MRSEKSTLNVVIRLMAILAVLLTMGGGIFILQWLEQHPEAGLRDVVAEGAYRAALLKRRLQVEPLQRNPLPLQRAQRPLRIIAHRGAARFAPENTLPAIQAALERGAAYIEIDVRETADGVAVLMHDATVERTTNGVGAVDELTLAEVRALDAGSWFGDEFAGTSVPVLQEVFELVRGRACLVWDLKARPSRATVSQFKNSGFTRDCLLVLSGKQSAERQLRRAQLIWYWPEVALMPVLRDAADVPALLADHPQVQAFWISRGIDRERLAAAHRAGVPVFTMTDFQWDSAFGYRKIYDAGFDAVLLDNFDEFADFMAAELAP